MDRLRRRVVRAAALDLRPRRRARAASCSRSTRATPRDADALARRARAPPRRARRRRSSRAAARDRRAAPAPSATQWRAQVDGDHRRDRARRVLEDRRRAHAAASRSPAPVARGGHCSPRSTTATPSACACWCGRRARGALVAATPERLVRRDGDVVRATRSPARSPRTATIARDADAAREREGSPRARARRATRSATALEERGARRRRARPSRRSARCATCCTSTRRSARRCARRATCSSSPRALHPTPAVGGTPTAVAIDWIAAHEPVARGWYALAGRLVRSRRQRRARRRDPLGRARRRPRAPVGRCRHRRGLRPGSRARGDRAQAARDARRARECRGDERAASRRRSWAELLAATLADAGVRDVRDQPGLAVDAARRRARARAARSSSSTIIDERAAAFFALGVARATGAPAALVCTSGTAAAHYLPAIVEASLAGVPLVAITADRPPELQQCGASQTIDQIDLYGGFVRGAFDLGAPVGERARAARGAPQASSRRSRSRAARTPGPVHVEVPLRKPLEPARADDRRRARARARVADALRRRRAIAPPRARRRSGARSTTLAAAIAAEPDGVIVAGALPAAFASRATPCSRSRRAPAIRCRRGRQPAPVRAAARRASSCVDHFDLIPPRRAARRRALVHPARRRAGRRGLAGVARRARAAPRAGCSPVADWHDPDSAARGVILGDRRAIALARARRAASRDAHARCARRRWRDALARRRARAPRARSRPRSTRAPAQRGRACCGPRSTRCPRGADRPDRQQPADPRRRSRARRRRARAPCSRSAAPRASTA